MSDLIVDFESHLRCGYVYMAEIELEMQDSPDDAPSSMSADVYVVAQNHHQAQYIVLSMYPDALSIYVIATPITEYEYAARRNRSIL